VIDAVRCFNSSQAILGSRLKYYVIQFSISERLFCTSAFYFLTAIYVTLKAFRLLFLKEKPNRTIICVTTITQQDHYTIYAIDMAENPTSLSFFILVFIFWDAYLNAKEWQHPD